jgi:hypothetical protein
MERYLFVLPGSLTCRPIFDRPEPDQIEFHVYGFADGDSVLDTVKDLIEMDLDSGESLVDPPFSLKFETRRWNLWIKNPNTRCGLAG